MKTEPRQAGRGRDHSALPSWRLPSDLPPQPPHAGLTAPSQEPHPGRGRPTSSPSAGVVMSGPGWQESWPGGVPLSLYLAASLPPSVSPHTPPPPPLDVSMLHTFLSLSVYLSFSVPPPTLVPLSILPFLFFSLHRCRSSSSPFHQSSSLPPLSPLRPSQLNPTPVCLLGDLQPSSPSPQSCISPQFALMFPHVCLCALCRDTPGLL